LPHTPDELLAYLDELRIETETTDHAPVFTVEESRSLRGLIPGAHTKNLFLRDNKKSYFLVTLDENRKVDLKALRHLIGAKGGLSFGSPEALYEHLGIRPGSVSPLAALNDKSGAVTVILEKGLTRAAVVNCHPLTNDRTTSIAAADLLTFLRATGHEPMLIDFDEAGSEG
jgi:Ala-tRNA(Pro) deacylase